MDDGLIAGFPALSHHQNLIRFGCAQWANCGLVRFPFVDNIKRTTMMQTT